MAAPLAEDDYIYPTYLGIGTVHAVAAADEDGPENAGRLLVPDPEQRNGWREFYVKKPRQEKPGARPIGFGRP